jgi:hypothetical protein
MKKQPGLTSTLLNYASAGKIMTASFLCMIVLKKWPITIIMKSESEKGGRF